ncbi:rhomboid family intramembrane serine protease [Sphingomonas sp.]|uniref:rhomboid family intramembrane serine protease n=1 Tax=Sphingomonas sp. TaxID=28214 RepID=UPI00286BF8BD|nr:rhomboid family intramembrane serine protease [Sphingomonas sp.]
MLLRQRATIVLMAVTGLVSLGILATGNLNNAATALGFIPARVSGFAVTPSVLWWLTPLTATLVHAGFLHLAMNFLLFAYCGRQVESVLGPGPLVLLYLIGAYAAAAGQYLLDPMSASPTIGASGAISALVGAYAVSFGQPKRIVASFKLNRWLNVAWLMIAWVVLQWMIGYLMGQQGMLLATGAHIGGFIAGVLLQKPLLLWRYRRA